MGKTVIGFAEAPTPWQCMLTVLRKHGVDPARVRIERERPGPEAVAAFKSGHGDFLEQTQPVTEQLISEGAAHLVVSMGEATGPVPFTSYMTTPAFLKREPDVVLRFTRAVYRTQRWLAAAPAAEVASVIGAHFPEIDLAMRERIVARFAKQDTWSRDPLLRRAGLRLSPADPPGRRLHHQEPSLRGPGGHGDRPAGDGGDRRLMRVRAWAALISLALLAGLGVAALAPAQPKEVVFLGFGGTHEKNLREHAIPAFEKQSGIKVIYVAVYLSRATGRRRAYLTLVILAPLLISVVVRSFGWLVILGPNGLVNSALRGLGLIDEPLRLLYTETAITLGLVHVFLSFMVLSVATALGRIDPAVLRAAASLGAGPVRTFLRVVLPLSLPGVAAGSVIVFTLSASAFITPALLGGPRVKVMSYLAYQQTMLLSDWPYGAAIALVLLAMTSAGVLVYLRLLESGRLGVVFR